MSKNVVSFGPGEFWHSRVSTSSTLDFDKLNAQFRQAQRSISTNPMFDFNNSTLGFDMLNTHYFANIIALYG